jgi:hypothetical protein
MAIGVFLSAMDATIVVACMFSFSRVLISALTMFRSAYATIGSELNQLQNTSWIATAYMLTLTSFQ